jgi:hypothetical protein
VTQDDLVLEFGVGKEALHALEANPRLLDARRTDHHARALDGDQMVQGEQGGKLSFRIAPRQDRDDLPRLAEEGTGDPPHVGLQRLLEQLAETLEAFKPGPDRLRAFWRDCGHSTSISSISGRISAPAAGLLGLVKPFATRRF